MSTAVRDMDHYSVTGVSSEALKRYYLGWFSNCCFVLGIVFFVNLNYFKVPMELRPCKYGTEYVGPVRVPVKRSSGAQTFPGVTYRPVRRFWHLRSADFNKQKQHFQEMADQRRADRKAQEESIRTFGPDISEDDSGSGPLDGSCKILKFIESGGIVRLFYRRQGRLSFLSF